MATTRKTTDYTDFARRAFTPATRLNEVMVGNIERIARFQYEVTAHFDDKRRAALFAEIIRLGAQAWMTGTDAAAFSALRGRAQFRLVEDGRVGDA